MRGEFEPLKTLLLEKWAKLEDFFKIILYFSKYEFRVKFKPSHDITNIINAKHMYLVFSSIAYYCRENS